LESVLKLALCFLKTGHGSFRLTNTKILKDFDAQMGKKVHHTSICRPRSVVSRCGLAMGGTSASLA